MGGILCEFEYIPLTYNFSLEDKKKTKIAYSRYNTRKKSGLKENETKIQLYMDLADVRKLSKNKLPIFENFIKNNTKNLKNCLIFVETMEYGKLIQDIIIHYDIDYHTYYADDEKQNLKKFANGEFDLLITCKKLSQGIDINSVQNIILFSCSRGKLETIQRIGRCLRIDPKNPNKKSNVIDFVLSKEEQKDYEDYEDADFARQEWLTDISKTKRSKYYEN